MSNLSVIVAGVVAAQWIAIAIAAVIAPKKMRNALAVSTAIFAGGWLYVFNAPAAQSGAVQAAVVTGLKHEGSCASVRNEMTSAEVQRKLGKPDEVRNDEVVRGPGSATLIYRDLRCAVHLFDERVELVD